MGGFPPGGRISAWGAGYRLLGGFPPVLGGFPFFRQVSACFCALCFHRRFDAIFTSINRHPPSYRVFNSFGKNFPRTIMASSFDVALSGWLSSLGVREKEFLRSCGCEYLPSLRYAKLDSNLIYAAIGFWDPNTHSR